jgi:prolipoprotein diacylglyceryltransferase/predicted O-methyltransferase YrrM
MVWVGLMVAMVALRADLARRRLPGDAALMILVIGLAGVLGSKIYHVLEEPGELAAHPELLISNTGFAWFGGMLGGLLALWYLARHYRIPELVMLDVASPAAALGYAFGRLGCLLSGDGDYGIPTSLPWGMSFPHGLVPTTARVHPTPIYEFLAWVLIAWFLWKEGRRQAQWHRPTGLVFGEYMVLTGLARLLVEFIRLNPRHYGLSNAQWASLGSMAAGGAVIAMALRHYFGEREEHRIIQHVNVWGEGHQPEATPPTPECPHPERWRMMDPMTAEAEVLEFLKALVTTLKPELIVETGTFMGVSTVRMAEGLKANGFGKIVTIEYDPVAFAKAKERIDGSGLKAWIEYRNASSLETPIEGRIDLLFSDSDLGIREQEVRRFLLQMNPHGLIVMHDASSHFKVVREAAQRLEAEGLISVVLLPTPRGMVLAQKRQGRK